MDRSFPLIPLPPTPGLYLAEGGPDLVPWALERLSQALAPRWPLVWVDAANAFNAHLVGMAARAAGLNPRDILSAWRVARPFTAWQLERMVAEKVFPAFAASRARLIVAADPLHHFKDAQGRDTQIEQCFSRFLKGTQRLSTLAPVLVLDTGRAPLYRSKLERAATYRMNLSYLPSPEAASPRSPSPRGRGMIVSLGGRDDYRGHFHTRGDYFAF